MKSRVSRVQALERMRSGPEPPVGNRGVRETLNRLGLLPSRTLGQNFLTDSNILKIIVSTADLSRKDAVLEIGPGLGALTDELLKRAGRVIAIEKDGRLAEFLKAQFCDSKRFELIWGDATRIDFSEVITGNDMKVVSNLPYSVASLLLVEMAMAPVRPAVMVVTVQEEVAERLAAVSGTRAYGKLTILVQMRYSVERIRRISPSCFWPKPEVNSTLLRLCLRKEVVDEDTANLVKMLITSAFRYRRKQMGTIFSRMTELMGKDLWDEAAIGPRARPEQIPLHAWIELARSARRRMARDGIDRKAIGD